MAAPAPSTASFEPSSLFPARARYHAITSTTCSFPYLLPHLAVPPLASPANDTPTSTASAPTVLLIHGALSSHHEFRHVSHSAHLQSYHLLIPSMHSCGPDTSLGIQPFSLERVASLLAHLIRTSAPDGRAHVVGVSLGAHVAIALAGLFPEVVRGRCLFVSGYNRFGLPTALRPIVPYFFYGLMKGPTLLLKGLVKWAMDGADVLGGDAQTSSNCKIEDMEVKDVSNMELIKEIVGPVFGKSDVFVPGNGLQGRVCIVVATKGSWLIPTDDKIPHAKVLLHKVQGKAGENVKGKLLVQHKGMRHPWDLQAPELFAESVVGFIEGRKLDAGFEAC